MSSSSYFLKSGNVINVQSIDAVTISNELPVGNYMVQYNPQQDRYSLMMVDSFSNSGKLYGDTIRNAKRILDTFESRSNSTGVLLSGEKGSGKTLLIRMISIMAQELKIPTIIINAPFHGDTFNKFLQDISQPCIILFDEYEKVYDIEDQEASLTLFDGVYQSKKLFLLTCNNKSRIDANMINRPGRIYYLLDFDGLSEEFIREYCEDNLENKDHVQKICDISITFRKFNFDMLKALIEEMNRYDESSLDAIKMLNIDPIEQEEDRNALYTIKLHDEKDKLIKLQHGDKWHGNPIDEYMTHYYKKGNKEDQMATFGPTDITFYNAQQGVVTFKNSEGYNLTLTKLKYKFDPLAF